MVILNFEDCSKDLGGSRTLNTELTGMEGEWENGCFIERPSRTPFVKNSAGEG